jgi:acyl-CoA thioester hydrolase
MSELKKELESTAFIAFADCDPFRHLNNARYIDYFLNAREQQVLADYRFSLADWGAKGKGWFVTQNQVAYLKPANYSETVIIVSRLLEFTDYELRLEMIMWDRKKVNIKSVMWSSFSHIDLVEGKRIEHNEELKSIFTAALYNEENAEKQNFDGRVEQLKTMKAVNAI